MAYKGFPQLKALENIRVVDVVFNWVGYRVMSRHSRNFFCFRSALILFLHTLFKLMLIESLGVYLLEFLLLYFYLQPCL